MCIIISQSPVQNIALRQTLLQMKRIANESPFKISKRSTFQSIVMVTMNRCGLVTHTAENVCYRLAAMMLNPKATVTSTN